MHGIWGFITDDLAAILFLVAAVGIMLGNSIMAGYAVNDRATVWDNEENEEFSVDEKRRLERRSRWLVLGVILTILPGFAANVLLVASTMLFQADPDTRIPYFWLVIVVEVLLCVAWISYLLRTRRRWRDKEHLIMPFAWFKNKGGDTD